MSLLNGRVCMLSSTDRFEAIRELISKSSAFEGLSDHEAFTQEVIAREKIQSTGIGRGVAIAHGKCPFVKRVNIGLGIAPQGIEFDALDGKPVHLLFVIASAPALQLHYLKALSKLIKWVKQKDVREALMSMRLDGDAPAGKAQDVLALLEEQRFDSEML